MTSDRCPLERRKGLQGLELTREAATTGGVGATSVRHVLSSSVPVSPTFLGGYLGFVRGNIKESRGRLRGIPTVDNKAGGGATEGQDMSAGVSREGPREGRNSDPMHVY